MVSIDTVIYFQVTDPKAATYEIADFIAGIEQLTVTTLRNVIGGMTLEDTLTSRDQINAAAAHGARRGDRQVGHPREPRRAQGGRPAALDPGGDGEADARRARPPRRDPHRRGRQAVADPHRRGREAVAPSCGPRASARPRSCNAEGQSKAIETVFAAIHQRRRRSQAAGLPVPAGAAADRRRATSNKVWIIPSEFTQALATSAAVLPAASDRRRPPPPPPPSASLDADARHALSERLQAALADVRSRGTLTEDDVNKAMRQVRLALLEADVNFTVVKQFTAAVKERALGPGRARTRSTRASRW